MLDNSKYATRYIHINGIGQVGTGRIHLVPLSAFLKGYGNTEFQKTVAKKVFAGGSGGEISSGERLASSFGLICKGKNWELT